MQVPIGSQLARITRRSTLRAALMFSKDTSKAPESEIRIAILLLGQRPPRAVLVVGRSCSIAEAISWDTRACDFMLARSDTWAGQPVALITVVGERVVGLYSKYHEATQTVGAQPKRP